MRTWADVAAVAPPSKSLNRNAGEGPPRCCNVQLVAADALIWWGGLPALIIGKAKARFPRLSAVANEELYLCSNCGETLVREKLITREELARSQGLSERQVAKAWLHDEEFWRRGPESAPSEVTSQPWWIEYLELRTKQESTNPDEAAKARRQWKTDVQALMRRYAPSR